MTIFSVFQLSYRVSDIDFGTPPIGIHGFDPFPGIEESVVI